MLDVSREASRSYPAVTYVRHTKISENEFHNSTTKSASKILRIYFESAVVC